MGTKAVSVYEQVMEKSKLLSFRAQSMAFQLEKGQTDKQVKVKQVQKNVTKISIFGKIFRLRR